MIPDERVAAYMCRVREAYPDLSAASARRIDHGQNNDVMIVAERIVFRFPRYRQGIAQLERETKLLRRLQRSVALAIPNPLYACFEEPTPGRAFMGCPMIPGMILSREALAALRDERTIQALASQLATFLKQLHGVPLLDLPIDVQVNSDPLPRWEDLYARIQHRLFPYMRMEARAETTRHFETFLQSQHSAPVAPVLVHGDFGADNILYDPETMAITGIVDFSSADADDPAVDFAAASTMGEGFPERFLTRYPEMQSGLERVPFYRSTFALQEALFGIENGDEEAFQAGIESYR